MCCCHVDSRAVSGLEGGKSSELCLQLLILCPASSRKVQLSLHCCCFSHFWNDGALEGLSNSEQQRVFRSRYEIKSSIVLELVMQLPSPEFLFLKWYAVLVSRLALRKCMCLVSEKLPDRNHKYLRWSGRNGLEQQSVGIKI